MCLHAPYFVNLMDLSLALHVHVVESFGAEVVTTEMRMMAGLTAVETGGG